MALLTYRHPGIGQCVGAHNHKVCLCVNACRFPGNIGYVVFLPLPRMGLSVLSVDVLHPCGQCGESRHQSTRQRRRSADCHHRVVSQVLHERLNATHGTRHRSFLFIWFTVALLATHARLITMNWSTVEQLNTSRMKERETRVLSRLHAWYQFDAKQRTRQEWDEQWGRIGKEGNLYWLGSARKNWEAVMGDKWYQWIRESSFSMHRLTRY